MFRLRFLLLLPCLLLQLSLMANMAEPGKRGSKSARPFTNAYTDILHEELRIKPAKDFRTARFDIAYHIRVDKDGVNIPLLFVALEYSSGFTVSVDGVPVPLMKVPEAFQAAENTPFSDFAYLFDSSAFYDEEQHITVMDSKNGGNVIRFDQLKYFETDLSKGDHIIRVSYTAFQWINGWNWVNEYSFRYALSPATYWRSFGTMTLTVDASELSVPTELQLGKKYPIPAGDSLVLTVAGIPSPLLEVVLHPKISKWAQFLITTGPVGPALFVLLIFYLFHAVLLLLYRRKNPSGKLPRRYAVLRIINPFIFVVSCVYAYDYIDNAIGIHAAGSHGYTFFYVVLYPVVLLLYYVLSVFTDFLIRFIVKKLRNSKLNAPAG